jgi:hypothetical protein
VVGLALALFVCACGSARAEAVVDANPHHIHVGWEGHVVLGAWTPVSAEVAVSQAGRYRLVVSATDPDGNLARYIGEEASLVSGTHRLDGRFQLGRDDGQILVRVERDGQPWKDLMATTTEIVRILHRQSERLLITVGLPAELQDHFPAASPGQRTVVHFPDPSELPVDDLAYDGVAGLFLAGRSSPSEQQAAAILRWLRRGGRLTLSIGMTPAEFRETPLVKGLPVEIGPEPLSTRELTALESFAGKSVRIVPTGQRVMIPKISLRFGKSLAGSRSDPVLVQFPVSFGAVTLLGMDVTQPPLTLWPGVGELVRKLTEVPEEAAGQSGRSQQLATTGISDLASQVAAALEDFDSVSRTSPWWVIGGLFVIMALVGPLDYWLVDRVWRRPLSTWISFPLFLGASAAAAAWGAATFNGGQLMMNQLDVVDVDAASNFVRGRHWFTLYSPQSATYELTCRPAWTAWGKPAGDAVQAIGWAGLPETAFGGMYRSGASGFQFGRVEYAVAASEGTITGVPTAQWSTTALSSVSDGSAANLIESNLASSATGRLSGTIIHHLPGPLANWFLAYENRMYRLPERDGSDAVGPLPQDRVFRVDQRAVVARELRGYLTRTTARHVASTGTSSTASSQIVMQQAVYDPLSRNLSDILPLLTFHTEVGGTGYTSLRNDVLSESDLTPLLRLDRAVLIGFLEIPAAEATVNSGPAPPGRRTTLVRFVLPVDRAKQALPQLPKIKTQ